MKILTSVFSKISNLYGFDADMLMPTNLCGMKSSSFQTLIDDAFSARQICPGDEGSCSTALQTIIERDPVLPVKSAERSRAGLVTFFCYIVYRKAEGSEARTFSAI